MKKFIFFPLILFALIGFGLYLSLFVATGNSFSKKRTMAFDIIGKLSQKYENKYGLRYMGITEGTKDGKYDLIGLYLTCNTILTKDQGRILLLNCLRDTLDTFNSCQEFEQYMINYPFTRDNVFIDILVQLPGVSAIYYPNITSFSISRGRLTYNAETIEVPYLYAHEEVETYEEALKIVETQNNGLLKSEHKDGSSTLHQ